MWMNAIPRGVFKKGVGTTRTVFTLGNSQPVDDEPTWEAVTLNSLADTSNYGLCNPTWNDVEFGYFSENYSPEKFSLRGPTLCKDDLNFHHNVDEFLSGYVEELAKYSEATLANRLCNKYRSLVPHWACTSTFVQDTAYTDAGTGTIAGIAEATSELTQEHLDTIAVQLIHDRATDSNSNGFVQLGPEGPIFVLYIGMEASSRIATNNSEFRLDVRDAEPSQLMKRMGATRVIKNMRHAINILPPRFSYAAGTYTRVNTWVNDATVTDGTAQKLNPNWISKTTAPYEGAFIVNPNVMTEELIAPDNVVGGVEWDPSRYFGEWQWVTGVDAIGADTGCLDPLKKRGRHFAEYFHAFRPGPNKLAGAFIIFKRCPISHTDATCS
ncbi:MAG: hypothetical protein ACE5HE_00160 [Phycisphaerae bacterium]